MSCRAIRIIPSTYCGTMILKYRIHVDLRPYALLRLIVFPQFVVRRGAIKPWHRRIHRIQLLSVTEIASRVTPTSVG